MTTIAIKAYVKVEIKINITIPLPLPLPLLNIPASTSFYKIF